MITKHLVYILAIVITVITIAACNKCDPPTYPLSATQKSFSNFKVGSYWIMHDTLSGRRDSFVVYRMKTFFSPSFADNDCYDNVETTIVSIKESNINPGLKDSLIWNMAFYGNGFQEIRWGKSEDDYHITGKPFDLMFDRSCYLNNGNLIDSVSIDATNSFYLNRKDIFLKIVFNDSTDHFVWELEKANIIR